MSEEGLAVGTGITVDGGRIVYIKQLNPVPYSEIQYRIDNQDTWHTASFSFSISNRTPENGIVQVIFITDLYLAGVSDYFICSSGDIQFGSTSLNSDGTRPTIYISAPDYVGFIFNGSSVSDGHDNITIYLSLIHI